MVNNYEQLRNIIKQRTGQLTQLTPPQRSSGQGLTKLGNVINELLEKKISPLQGRLALITELWERLVPAELRQHCRIVGISGSLLNVLADSPSFASELRWYSQNILGEIKQQCPKARIKDIKCVIGQERT